METMQIEVELKHNSHGQTHSNKQWKTVQSIKTPEYVIDKIVLFENLQKFALISAGGPIQIWDSTRKKCIKRIKPQIASIDNVIQCKEKRLAVVSPFHQIVIWNIFTGQFEAVLHEMYAISLLDTSQYVITGTKNWLKLWDVDFPSMHENLLPIIQENPARIIKNPKQGACYVIILLAEHMIACGSAKCVNTYHLQGNNEPNKTLVGHEGLVLDLICVDYGAKIVSLDDKGIIKVWDWMKEACLRTIESEDSSDGIFCIVMYTQNIFISGDEENRKLQFYEVNSGELVQSMEEGLDYVGEFMVNKDQMLIVCGRERISCWNEVATIQR